MISMNIPTTFGIHKFMNLFEDLNQFLICYIIEIYENARLKSTRGCPSEEDRI